MKTQLNAPWHSLSKQEIFQILQTQEEGLTTDEASRRIEKFSRNEIGLKKKGNLFLQFLNQFRSPLVYVLLVAAVVTFIFEYSVDTWVILTIVILNAFFGFLYEFRAEKALEILSKALTLKAKVKRRGILMEIAAGEIVPGDIVEVVTGDKVPADLRIIQEENLRVDEAILTGESVPQEKTNRLVLEKIPLADRTNLLFSGTMVISGRAQGVVVATGSQTEFGKIAQKIEAVLKTETPLQARLKKFSTELILIVLASVAIIFATGILKGQDIIQMFLIAIAAAISAIPEGLPAVITITLATGAHLMSKKKAIVKRLLAVETLGSVTVIASDKTGTLTRNQMTVEKVYLANEDQVYSFSGSGYEPKGNIEPKPGKNLLQFLTFGLLCNNGEIFEKNQHWETTGDPTESALLAAGGKANLFKEKIDHLHPRLDEIPFDTKFGFMATLHQCPGKNLIIVKGKIEEILKMAKISPPEVKIIISQMEEFARSALRVIAVGYKYVSPDIKELSHADLKNLHFVGFAGMIDPPRQEAVLAIQQCQKMGIRPIMITGDHPLTAQAIARKMGLIKEEQVISSLELEKMSEDEFQEVLKNYGVFARISPQLKLKIIEGLQKQNQIVAVTGDGINDAPALKRADIGVAMGEGGTDAAREVADLILTDNNFSTIVLAVEQGRTIFKNIRRTIFYLLSTNVGELFILFFALLILPAPYSLPLLPVQILWINLVTDGTAGLALAVEPPHNVSGFSPRETQSGILNKIIVGRIILVALVMLGVTMFLYFPEVRAGEDISRARTIAFTTMVILQILNVLNSRSLRQSIFLIPFFSNKYILGSMILSFTLSLLTIYLPPLRALFHTVSLSLTDWLKVISLSLLIIVVIEIEKFLRRKTHGQD